MNLAEYWIRHRVVTLVLTFVTVGGGVMAFQGMSRLEDPEFTIKDALVLTPYPGATAEEVEQEVSDEIELAVQKLGQLKEIESRSTRNLSTVTVSIQDKYDKNSLPQVWDELRRKVNDAQSSLPPGAGPSLVIDDYGDVFGVFVAVYGSEYSYAEIKEVTDLLRRELILVQDVAKIDTYGERQEAVYVELSRDRISQLGITPEAIADKLRQKNFVSNSGRVTVGPDFISIQPSGTVDTIEDLGDVLISGGATGQIYLRDVGHVRRGYIEPQDKMIRYDGNPAIGLGISTVAGGNVVVMGEALDKRIAELRSEIPLGIEAGIVSMQSTSVVKAIDGFVISLVEAVVIVVLVLLCFMGVRSGMLIGFVLVQTILASFIFLQPMGVALERISLGALIIALGMLVDNAIVIVDGVLVRMQQGQDAETAAKDTVAQSAIPLLGATIIAILAFAAIGTSDDSTGEFCRSLYQVVLVSLLMSWVTAVTVTPLLCVMFLKSQAPGEGGEFQSVRDPYDTRFYKTFKGFLHACIGRRWASVGVVLALFASSIYGFGMIESSFFPPSTRPQFTVDVWLPAGTSIDETRDQVIRIEEYLETLPEVRHVSSLIDQGGLRFLLTYTPEKSNSAYAQLLVDVDDPAVISDLLPRIEEDLVEVSPDALTYAARFQLGPGSTGKVQARFSGPEIETLRTLAIQAVEIFANDPDAKSIRTDWQDKVKRITPIIADQAADANGIQRPDVARVMLAAFQGAPIGSYREKDLILPIIMRAPEAERSNVSSMRHLQIYSPAAGTMIPLRQVVSGFATVFEDEIVVRRDRIRTITVYGDPVVGQPSGLFDRVRPAVDALELPPGYSLEWGGEYEDSGNARAALVGSVPLFTMMMVLITVVLFNSLKQPLVIWLNVPLALIGVTVGLLVTHQPFGFMSILGFLSLMGMLIKNAIVLVDQINFELAAGKAQLAAIIDSCASRLRPVAMAASTTALGMIPLVTDAFFSAMAVTIIFGLIFATVLTMVILPVFYSIVFNVSMDKGS
ncbi:MAG: efflux RND transporter permease subunit [Gemmatimonadota bacterium]|nr:efflux RND transporter permease subunit [Gemmatimonadota bacterium]